MRIDTPVRVRVSLREIAAAAGREQGIEPPEAAEIRAMIEAVEGEIPVPVTIEVKPGPVTEDGTKIVLMAGEPLLGGKPLTTATFAEYMWEYLRRSPAERQAAYDRFAAATAKDVTDD